jgi:hypothetical protein
MMTWYDDAMRTIIDLPEEQVQALAELCARENISRAEAIRRAVEEFLRAERQDEVEFRRALQATFGIWKNRGIDTDAYLSELRKEWDREWEPD